MISELSRFRGCLLGVAIGDALGTPYEMKSREEILKITDGKGILGFNSSITRKRDDGLELLTSDDFQLTEVVGWSLVRRKCFDILDIALAHVETLEKNGTSGWGSTTRNGVLELKEYFDSRGTKGRSPFQIPKHIEGKGCGNGVAMKMMPAIIIEKYALYNEFVDVGKLTHSDPRSWVAAFVLSELIHDLHKNEKNEFPRWLVVAAKEMERCYNDVQIVNESEWFYNKLSILKNKELLFGPIEKLAETIGTSCLATESVVFAIAVYLRNKNDFRKGALEAVNFAKDADTVCSIVAALIGYNVGMEGIPEEWIEYSPEFKNAIILADALYETFR